MEVLHNSCNMCTCVLPDTYIQPHPLGLWLSGIRMYISGRTFVSVLQLLNVHNLVQHHIETADVKPMLEEFLLQYMRKWMRWCKMYVRSRSYSTFSKSLG